VLQHGSELRLCRGDGDLANERGEGTPRHGLIVAWEHEGRQLYRSGA
jgi:hypothetical protein